MGRMKNEEFFREEGDEYDPPSFQECFEKKKRLRKPRKKDTVHRRYMNDLPFRFAKSSLLKKNTTNLKGGEPI